MPNFNKNDFSGNPVRLDTARSKFSMPFKHKTTFKAGQLIPIFSYGDVLPGDTFKIDLSCLVRMTTPVFPTMDDAYLDVYFFFTPHKLVLSRKSMSPAVDDSNHSWNAFIGAQDNLLNMPLPANDISLPIVLTRADDGEDAQPGSLTDYLGISLGRGSGSGGTEYANAISALEPLAYYSIWNNYFRDENTQNPVVYSIGSAMTTGNPLSNGFSCVSFSGGPLDNGRNYPWGSDGNCIGGETSIMTVCRPHGYFGSALPWPQRNNETVSIPLLGSAPVVRANNGVASTLFEGLSSGNEFNLTAVDGQSATGYPVLAGLNSSSTWSTDESGEEIAYLSGLAADLSQASGVSVNQLRLMVQTQRFYEALARGGNRIGEMTSSMFGVTPSDLAQDRPEYLGGKRIPISMDQVANTAGSVAGSEGQTLGSLGAYSNTGDSSFYFEKSFDTWGTITCVVAVRTNETFSQGIARRYARRNRLDFYFPVFANLGEQEIVERELYAPSAYDADQEDVFGYQEAWAEYRYLPDVVSGYLRPDLSLGSYTYANDFSTFPTLAGYIKGGAAIADNVDRTLVVPGSSAGFQFIGDFSFNIVATRPMPRYSIPGLVDHH